MERSKEPHESEKYRFSQPLNHGKEYPGICPLTDTAAHNKPQQNMEQLDILKALGFVPDPKHPRRMIHPKTRYPFYFSEKLDMLIPYAIEQGRLEGRKNLLREIKKLAE